MEKLYGSTLIFKTLRTGFPTANVFVYDNCSIRPAQEVIRQLAKEVGAEFGIGPFSGPDTHSDLLRSFICDNESSDPMVILDPDLVFWESCENWKFSRLLAGRLIPQFFDPFTQCVTFARFHTSFLWIKNPVELASLIQHFEKEFFNADLFAPSMFVLGDQWMRLDTAASLYQVIGGKAFGEKELNSYDHLFCGTAHVEKISQCLPEPFRHQMLLAHDAAKKGDLQSLRGLWKLQDQFFRQV